MTWLKRLVVCEREGGWGDETGGAETDGRTNEWKGGGRDKSETDI